MPVTRTDPMHQSFLPRNDDAEQIDSAGNIKAAGPYNSDGERSIHQHHIERLAEEASCSIQEIAPLYESILHDMKGNARIHDYLPLLVSKNVKHLLKSRR